MALFPRRVESAPTPVTVTTNDGTSFLNGILPSQYKESSTFTTLQAVYDSIGSAGGFAPLGIATAPGLITTKPILANKGPVRSQMMTSNEYNAITFGRAAGTQDGMTYDYDGQTAVWESAAWNGYGWFWIPSGGHYTGYRNDMYMIRIADPMMVVRLYNTAPFIAAVKRAGASPNPAGVGDRCVVPPQFWNQYVSPGLLGYPEWGPFGAHHYDGMQFDAATEKILWGGDTPVEILNPTAYGSVAQERVVLSVFDVNAATPKSAWSRHVPANWSGSTSIFGVMDRADGTYEFSGYASGGSGYKRYKYNPSTNAMTDTAPFSTSGVVDFGHVVRDPANNKVYETRDSATPSNIVEIGGSLNVSIGLFEDGFDGDTTTSPIIINGKAYCFGLGAAASGANKTVPLGVSRIDLATGARDLITNGLSVNLNVGSGTACSPYNGVDGLHGRVGYVPSVGAFVIFLSAVHDIYVFRPPASWGLIGGWSDEPATGNVTGNVWTPAKNSSGVVNFASWNIVPTNTWIEVANTALTGLDTQLKAQMLSTYGDTWSDVGYDSSANSMDAMVNAWVGWTWDERAATERFWVGPGGGHGASGNNGLYRFDARKMSWGIENLPTPRPSYPVSGYAGSTNYTTDLGAFINPATDYTPGPTGIWYDEIFDPAQPTHPTRSSRKPTSRHTYTGTVFAPELGAAGKIIMLCRRAWTYDLATGTWSLPRSYFNNADPQTYSSAENMFVWWDSATSRAYHCGNNASFSGETRNFWWDGASTFGSTGYYPASGWFTTTTAYDKQGSTLHHLYYENANPTKPATIYRHTLTAGGGSVSATIPVTFSGVLASVTWPSAEAVGYWDVGAMTYVAPQNRYLVLLKRVGGGASGGQDELAWIDGTTGVCTLASSETGALVQPYMCENKLKYVPTLRAIVMMPRGNQNLRIYKVA